MGGSGRMGRNGRTMLQRSFGNEHRPVRVHQAVAGGGVGAHHGRVAKVGVVGAHGDIRCRGHQDVPDGCRIQPVASLPDQGADTCNLRRRGRGAAEGSPTVVGECLVAVGNVPPPLPTSMAQPSGMGSMMYIAWGSMPTRPDTSGTRRPG